MNGGYIMIYKNSKKIYLELFACLTLGKPILWYEDKDTCFFIDTISGGEITTEIVDDEEVRTYGDIILTKGGMTITITVENVVTEEGDIQPSSGGKQLYQHNITLSIVDSFGFFNLVFVTDNPEPFTTATLRQFLADNNIIDGNPMYFNFYIYSTNISGWVRLSQIASVSYIIRCRLSAIDGGTIYEKSCSVSFDKVIEI